MKTTTTTQPTPRSNSPAPACCGDLALPMQVLRYDRSECNESRSQEMEGCLADNAGKIICFFPTPAALKRAQLFALAPEMAEALGEMCRAPSQTPEQSFAAWSKTRAILARLHGEGTH